MHWIKRGMLGWLALLLLTVSGGAGEEAFSLFAAEKTPAPGAFSMEVVASGTGMREDAPRIYLYHTHTYEAYSMDDGLVYAKTEDWRTADQRYNMLRVGACLAEYLENAGFVVYHDQTAYEPPRLSSAYSRSLEALKQTLSEPYDLYIDLHRDSYSEGNGPNTVVLNGEKAARLLILVGKGSGQTAEDEKPDWKANEKIGLFLTDKLNAQADKLCRGVSLKSGRYNQHVAPNCLLIEVGNNRNTLTEALCAMRPLALSISAYFDSLN